jgi:hypothetical protein
MNKPRVTLMDFLHIKKDEETLSVESEKVEEKIEEKETQHIYSVQEVTSYIRRSFILHTQG